MNITLIKGNMTELELGDMKVLFSYRTPVAACILVTTPTGDTWHQYKTTKKWSRTTSRHISQWNPLGGAFELKPQEYFDNLVS